MALAVVMNSAEFNFWDASLSIANVAHVKLLGKVGSLHRNVEDAQRREVPGDIRF